MASHSAIQVVDLKQPLTIAQVPTITPKANEIRVRVEWVPEAPLDVYQVDAGLMINQYPHGLGDSISGTVVEIGDGIEKFKIGDRVCGFVFHSEQEKAQQVFVTAPEHLFAQELLLILYIPAHVSSAAASTLPNNFCTAYFTLSEKLGVKLPWPPVNRETSEDAQSPIIIWGAAASVGQYALQILKHWGYTNVIAVASPKHQDKLLSLGARYVVDYRDSAAAIDTIRSILNEQDSSAIVRAFDCVDSKTGSLIPLSKIVTKPGSTVAALLPVVVSSPDLQQPDTELAISFDVQGEAEWATDVKVQGVAVYAYEANAFLRDNLMPEILGGMLAQGAVQPNQYREIHGDDLLTRAQKALDIMRSGTVSGERLVWKVWDER
ncbi:alcohol dehydrogenase [Aureobasidium pullulans]|nr:alcohol dehydrogenase [Aureobasidium pullulans]